ncbi:MAG: hypothetical protein KY476_04460 [Planctomycetes bacterium]|nr:hypothetical protein [Planctomycetota bacterium]
MLSAALAAGWEPEREGEKKGTGLVNQPQTDAELDALRRSVRRGQPFGSEAWVQRTATHLGLGSSLRSRGGPRLAAE